MPVLLVPSSRELRAFNDARFPLRAKGVNEQWLSFGAPGSRIPWPHEIDETLAAIHEVLGDQSRSE
jgi:hypothetical protein